MNRASQLQDYLNAFRNQRLKPGRQDCALFAAGWVERVTGRDHAETWRETYGSLNAGRRALRRAGFASLADLAGHHLPEVAGWMAAQTGDVAVVIEDGHEAMGIVSGGVIHCLGMRGLDIVPLSRARRVFRP